MRNIMIMALLGVLVLAACTSTAPPATNTTNTTGNTSATDSSANLGACSDPRPQACTREYMPVCGDNGQTYGNKCEACADSNVSNYTQGECAKLFEVTYAGGFVAPKNSHTIFSVSGNVFTAETRDADEQTTSLKQRTITTEERDELNRILAGIGTLKPEYKSDVLVTDVGYADITIGTQQTRIDKNIDEAYPAELLALRNWISGQTMQLPDEQGRIYKSRDPDMCARIKFVCEDGQQYFGDDSGCGCEPVTDGGAAGGTRPALTECKPEQRGPGIACTMQYDPVCAQVDTGIRCIKAPCPSTEWKTYGNACSACGDAKVYGYIPGECTGNEDSANA